MRHNEPFSALWKLLPVLYFYFMLCDPTLQLTEMISEPVGLVSKAILAHLYAFWGYLHLSRSIIMAKATSGFNSDRTIQQYAHGLLLENPLIPSSTDCWAVRAKIRQKWQSVCGRRGETGSRNMAATQKINFLTLVSYLLLQTVFS